MDHSNIYVFIAATYTPLALLLLTGTSRVLLLSLIWAEAILGVLFRILWLGAPRWLYTVLYIGMGWAAVAWIVPLWSAGGPLVIGLIGTGGLIYTGGAVVYALKAPEPVAEVVRVPRDLPHRYGARRRLPLRRDRADHLPLSAVHIRRSRARPTRTRLAEGAPRDRPHRSGEAPILRAERELVLHADVADHRRARGGPAAYRRPSVPPSLEPTRTSFRSW